MRNYYPYNSYSKKARALSDYKIELLEANLTTVQAVTRFFRASYRHKLIKRRAAKRFGRYLRKKGIS